ncbi:MAG: YceI family protein [Cyclobacteriaceae bacterium]|nr:YceI family protein [Cyclobacteriaceae bacterium]
MKFFSFLISITLIYTSCTTSKESEDAVVSNAKDVKSISNQANLYSLALDKSIVTWIGSKPAGKHNGTILLKSGELAIEKGEIIGGHIVIDIHSIETIDLKDDPERNDRLINHLKSNDFFDAEVYPTAIFEITSIGPYSSESNNKTKEEFESEHKPISADRHIVKQPSHLVTGNLSMRDTTLSITFPSRIENNDSTITAKAKFNIDRTNWNLKYRDESSVVDQTKDRFIYNTVNVGFIIEARKE